MPARVEALGPAGVLIIARVGMEDPVQVNAAQVNAAQVSAEHARASFRQAVHDWPEVLTCYALSGQWDYQLKVITPDLETYSHFLMERVLAQPVVVNVQSSFVLEQVKDSTALPLAHLGYT